jgi:hypothetical protein
MLRTLGVPHENLYGDKKEEPLSLLCGKSAREAMQTLGTEWGRDLIGRDLWMNAWEREYREMSLSHDVVCDDSRFQNETALILHLGGEVWMIESDRPTTNHAQHPSELALASVRDMATRTITNNGSIKDLSKQVLGIIGE